MLLPGKNGMGYKQSEDVNYNIPGIKCPYMEKHTLKEVYCTGGSRILFPTIAECRKWKLKYCCTVQGCTYARFIRDN